MSLSSLHVLKITILKLAHCSAMGRTGLEILLSVKVCVRRVKYDPFLIIGNYMLTAWLVQYFAKKPQTFNFKCF